MAASGKTSAVRRNGMAFLGLMRLAPPSPAARHARRGRDEAGKFLADCRRTCRAGWRKWRWHGRALAAPVTVFLIFLKHGRHFSGNYSHLQIDGVEGRSIG